MVPTQNHLRRVITHVSSVLLYFLVGRDNFAILVIQQEVSVVVEACKLIDVETTDSRTGFQTVGVSRVTREGKPEALR